MDYFTSREQEAFLREMYETRWRDEQDRHRMRRHRVDVHRPPQEQDRIFFVEGDGSVYLGEVHPHTKCPDSAVAGGGCYGIDYRYMERVQQFIQQHPHYMVVFTMERGYSYRSGIYPARMVADGEEMWLREE